jgi:CHAD domain-containing protein
MAKSKEIEGLDCDAGAGAMIRVALEARFGEMLEHRAAALEGDGMEGVHDMRVASRRLRSALRDFLPYLSAKRLTRPARDLKRLADALGRVRDEDVAIHALEKIAEESPAEARAGVEEFARERRARREEALASLVPELEPVALEELRLDLLLGLARAVRGRRRGSRKKGDPPAPEPTYADASREVILACWEELRERCESLRRPFKVKRLHEARISAKRLRYALELFAQCRGPHLKEVADEIAEMQKSLGDLHDCDEWIATLGDRLAARRAPVGGVEGVGVAERAAAVWLLGHFAAKRTKDYRDALARWHDWERDDFGSRLRASLAAEPAAETDAPADDPDASAETTTPDVAAGEVTSA